MDANYLFFGLLFSIIGYAYFSYGRKQNLYYMLTGIALMLYPYLVSEMLWLVLVGVLLMALPFVLNRVLPLD